MAKRIVYMKAKKAPFYKSLEVDFVWAPGLNKICRKRSITNLLTEIGRLYPNSRVLDVSYVSNQEIGVRLSSVALPITLASGKTIPVECAYQGSRLINHAGPFKELFDVDAMKAKDDPRMPARQIVVSFYRLVACIPFQGAGFFVYWSDAIFHFSSSFLT